MSELGMNDRQSEDHRLARYLLGDPLPAAEQAEIEEHYFTDDLYFDHVLAIEDELIDSHIRGNLPASDRARFEKHFLASKRRREKWEAQRAIASFFRSRAEPVGFLSASIHFFRSLTLAGRLAAGFSGAALAVGVVVLSWGYRDVLRERYGLESRLMELQKQAVKLPSVATFVLQSERLRSGPGDELRIPSDTRWVELQVEIPELAEEYSTLSAELSTADGQEVWEQKGLPRTAPLVELDLPVSMLKRGDYVLSLTAMAGAGKLKLRSYQFRIDR